MHTMRHRCLLMNLGSFNTTIANMALIVYKTRGNIPLGGFSSFLLSSHAARYIEDYQYQTPRFRLSSLTYISNHSEEVSTIQRSDCQWLKKFAKAKTKINL